MKEKDAILFDTFYICIEKLQNYIQNTVLKYIEDILDKNKKKNIRKNTFAILFFRINCLLKGILVLHETPDLQLLQAATRILFEIYIDIILLRKGGQESIKKYDLFYTQIERYQNAKYLVDVVKKNNDCKINIDKALDYLKLKKDEINNIRKNIWGKNINLRTWDGSKNIMEMAKKAGLLEVYLSLYRKYSAFVHSGISIANLTHEGNTYRFKSEPYSLIILITVEAIYLLCREFNLNITITMMLNSMEPEYEKAFKMNEEIEDYFR